MHFQRAESPLKIMDGSTARSFFAGCFRECDPATETLFVVHLDDRAHCVHLSRHPGDKSSADFPMRQIIGDAANHGTKAILLAHNHPSGDPSPSRSDCQLTRRLAAAVEAMDCTVLDHFIFGGRDCTSFRSLGLI